MSATLGLAALSAGLVSGVSASADTSPSQMHQTALEVSTAMGSRAAAPAVVADARAALERAERLTSESRTIGAKQRKVIKARSAALRALMVERADAPAASRSGDREPLEERADVDESTRADAEATAVTKDVGAAEAVAEGTTAEPSTAVDAGAEALATTAPGTTPGPLLATVAEEFVTPSLAPDGAKLADTTGAVDSATLAKATAATAAVADATVADAPVADAPAEATQATTEVELKRATDALTQLIHDTKVRVIKPAPATPREILTAQARAAKKAVPELAKYAKTLAGRENGEIPASVLCELSFTAGESLRCDAARQLERLDKAYRARFGSHLEINDSYRSYAAQVATATSRGYLAAVPGYSNHGWAVAVDLGGGVQRFGTAQHEWLRKHGRAFGWVNPAWARADGRKPEAWHWEYKGL